MQKCGVQRYIYFNMELFAFFKKKNQLFFLTRIEILFRRTDYSYKKNLCVFALGNNHYSLQRRS